ncbi:MAG TPA: hypothetical protein EYP14_01550 [Planctomycetaceae bacterium]|nr:hypothetical protein [Planctomycetaceae bacterium]
MSRFAARTDSAHAEIRNTLRRLGFAVFDTARLGNGYPDLHVSLGGFAVLVEVKSPGGRFTPAEADFAQGWQGPLLIARTVREAVSGFYKLRRLSGYTPGDPLWYRVLLDKWGSQ